MHRSDTGDEVLDIVIRRGVLDRPLEIVDSRQQLNNKPLSGAFALFLALASGPLAEVVELRLSAKRDIAHLRSLVARRSKLVFHHVPAKLELRPEVIKQLRIDARVRREALGGFGPEGACDPAEARAVRGHGYLPSSSSTTSYSASTTSSAGALGSSSAAAFASSAPAASE